MKRTPLATDPSTQTTAWCTRCPFAGARKSARADRPCPRCGGDVVVASTIREAHRLGRPPHLTHPSTDRQRRTSGIAPYSRRRRRRDRGYGRMRNEVFERAQGECEARVAPSCTGRCEQVHHKAGRGGPDPHDLGNLLGVCLPCHMFIGAHPGWAYKIGLLVRRHGGKNGDE